MRKRFVPAILVAVLALVVASPAGAHPGQHGLDDGHLRGTGDWGKIDLVGQVEVTQTDDLVATSRPTGTTPTWPTGGSRIAPVPRRAVSTPPMPVPG